MTCPHCGADASAGQKFCPKCSRLVNSPLLKIKQEIDAAREEIRRDLQAARLSIRSAAPPPLQEQYKARIEALGLGQAESNYQTDSRFKYAPHPSQTPGLTPPLPQHQERETIQKALNKRQRKKQRDEGITRAQHSDTTHRFDPTAAAKKAMDEAKAAAAAGPVPEKFVRPLPFSVLAILDIVAGMSLLFHALFLSTQPPQPLAPYTEFLRIFCLAAGALFMLTAFGMLKMHPFGRLFQRLLLLPVALWIPIGSFYAIATWAYLGSAPVRLYFSGRSPRSLNGKELAAWRLTDKGSTAIGVLLLVFSFAPGIAWSTFVSNTLPFAYAQAQAMFPQAFPASTDTSPLESGAGDPAANAAAEAAAEAAEAAAGGDVTSAPSASSVDGAPEGDSSSIAYKEVRLLQQAQAAYASLNEGYHDRLSCVLTPASCIRNGDERNVAVLLEPAFRQRDRHGYRFVLALSGKPDVVSETASATSMRGYSYRAVPGKDSGDRVAYCGDETGLICTFDALSDDGGNGGRCPAVCRAVQ
jgi:hypothetical protein